MNENKVSTPQRRVERGQNHVPFFVTYVPFECNTGGRKRNSCETMFRFLPVMFRLMR